ncbi:hypothetical protein E2C01_085204 [Portunus trituberculatus]|uniref:Uncharacterized protein n=1 Tax=Portunus trituberculatus TaxID=210409 RepID=A0A5B7J0C3_PORTR|nr:hypothetical protein [Portunus trituberculatus]
MCFALITTRFKGRSADKPCVLRNSGVVDKVVSVEVGRRPCVGSNPTTNRFETVICRGVYLHVTMIPKF